MLVLDGAYLIGAREPAFRRVAPPSAAELQSLVERLARRVDHSLERHALTAQGQVRYRLKTPLTATAPRTSCWSGWTSSPSLAPGFCLDASGQPHAH
jgi:hypothetical protein